MGNFLMELKRRHIYRVAAAYVVVAWVLVQVVNNLAPMLKLPDWIGPTVIVFLLVGFPVALIFAWILHLASAGGAERTKSGATDWLLTGALAVVIILIGYEQIGGARNGTIIQQANTVPGSASQPSGISIAVLPFANLSGDASQEFFSDGMTEEIMTALAKVQGLRVVARTSAFEFKGQNPNIKAIGQALGTAYLIEGSVRKAGTRVRIAAQLVQADSGVNIWTESYDRELTDVFAIEEDIGQAIAGALRVPLGLAQGERLVANRTNDVESYQQYLRARALLRARSVAEATSLLETLTQRNPNYAPLWALLAQAYNMAPQFLDGTLQRAPLEEARRSARAIVDRSEKAAREAIRLDPRHAYGYARLGNVQTHNANWATAETLYLQALALDPNDPDTLDLYSRFLAGMGRLKDALRVRDQMRALEPFVPIFNRQTADILLADGQVDDAIRLLQTMPSGTREFSLAQAFASEGRYSEAADALLTIDQRSNAMPRRSIEDAARLLRSAPLKGNTSDGLPALEGPLGFVYLFVGAPERSLEYPERLTEIAPTSSMYPYWGPAYADVRKTERFKAMIRKAGLVDYWRAKAWPDFCRPTTGDDFVCE